MDVMPVPAATNRLWPWDPTELAPLSLVRFLSVSLLNLRCRLQSAAADLPFDQVGRSCSVRSCR